VRVEVRLYATFAQYAPSNKAGDAFDVRLDEGGSISTLIHAIGIPETEVHLAIVNGRIIHDRSQALNESDRIALFPPVGGG